MYLKIDHSCNQIFDDKQGFEGRVHVLPCTLPAAYCVRAAAMKTSAIRNRDVDDATTRGVTPQ